MRQVRIYRHSFYGQEATLGTCYVYNGDKMLAKFESLERGWLDNQRNISCIPAGHYPLVLEYSPRFKKDLWEIKEVPNRSECKFHAANYWHQLNGCVALGNNIKHLDHDDVPDVTNSRRAMEAFHQAMTGKNAVLHIINIIDPPL